MPLCLTAIVLKPNMQTDHSPAYLRQSPIADERAQRLDVAYLRTLDADRLLAPYRTEAGLEPEGGVPGARDEVREAAAYFAPRTPRRNVRVIESADVPVTVVAGWFLADAKTGARNGAAAALMKPVVANLTIADMVALAAYLSSLEP
jgi:hypothetical protein